MSLTQTTKCPKCGYTMTFDAAAQTWTCACGAVVKVLNERVSA